MDSCARWCNIQINVYQTHLKKPTRVTLYMVIWHYILLTNHSEVLPVCPFAMLSLPNVHLPKQNGADRGTNRTNQSQQNLVLSHHGHPVHSNSIIVIKTAPHTRWNSIFKGLRPNASKGVMYCVVSTLLFPGDVTMATHAELPINSLLFLPFPHWQPEMGIRGTRVSVAFASLHY